MTNEKHHFKLVTSVPPEDFRTDDGLDSMRAVVVALFAAGLTILIALAFLWAMTQPIIAV